MIQRIQSLFLLLASVSCFGLFGTDVADTEAAVSGSELFADASFDLFDSPLLIGSVALSGLVLLAAIFLFRNRKLQATMVLAGVVLISFAIGFGGYAFFMDEARESAVADFGVALPLLAVVFAMLANRNISKDEKLVRSADRLR